MARIFPFQPYRYADSAGSPGDLVTQPYDKISPAMQSRYLSLSPYNLVRVILGERFPEDNDKSNVYTRAAGYFNDWIAKGILQREKEPSFFAYFQEFAVPDSGEVLTRKGFIGLGAVEDYSARIVHRHEQTLSGPKKDRRQVLDHTQAHFGQIFMLYPDRAGAIDAILDEAASGSPLVEMQDEYDTVHRLYRIAEQSKIRQIQELMADKKLLIADGHHRYETALAFKHDNPGRESANRVMMTFVNMYSPGLRILATHRVLSGIPNFDVDAFLKNVEKSFSVRKAGSADDIKQAFSEPQPGKIRIGVVADGGSRAYLLERARNGGLDVRVLHEDLLEGALGIGSDAVREEKYIKYVRGVDPAVGMVKDGQAQVAFLMEPTTIDQVADTSFNGGVMPQKSTDFYPKLLTGLTIYKLED
jgi:uncharacterized protein (DUF1015 family)